MEIHVYDRNLRRLGHIEDYTSLQWYRKYYECGTFELHCPVTEENLKLLQPGNIITKGDKKEAAVIRGDQTEEESMLKNEMIRTGFFLPIYLGDRLTGSLFNYNGFVEEAMYFILNRMVEIPLLQLGEMFGDTTRIQFQAVYKNVLEYQIKLAKYANIGFRIVPDFKKKTMMFETYKGIDRTQAQREHARVIFSESYENLNNVKHNYSDGTMITKVIVGGTGEGADRIYVEVGGGSGFDLREAFLDAKDINKDELTEAEYLEALTTRGHEYLNENKVFENFEAEAEAEVNFIYGKDYDLGDVVTVKKKKWGISQDLRITEICEVYENGGMYVVPTFGDALPTRMWEE
ncbi:MAG: siphovirus ReqiPepy6 Gp37-like family protein [Lachnospiraceae bacterium]|nr:siphovirus ReqiPepy6 Gp37-like family protein [Lachnospiraceae bacterium]